jgi:hypothetical protein
MRTKIASLLVAAGLLLPGPLHAQSWLDSAKDALGEVTGDSGGGSLDEVQIGKGLKEALRVATGRAVDEVAHPGGYLDDPAVRIPLPKSLRTVQSALSQVGMADIADNLQERMNRAAEAAAPEAREVFLDAVGQMTVEDARTILNGPNDAATRYFQETMTPALKDRMRPIVRRNLEKAGALGAFDDMMGQYSDLPLVPDVTANLTDHTLAEALDGLFHYLAQEERAIRKNPAARTTDLLKEVFG